MRVCQEHRQKSWCGACRTFSKTQVLLEAMFTLCMLRFKSRPIRPKPFTTFKKELERVKKKLKKNKKISQEAHNFSRADSASVAGCKTAFDVAPNLPTLNSSLPTNHLPISLTPSPLHGGSWPFRLSLQTQTTPGPLMTPKGLLHYVTYHSYPPQSVCVTSQKEKQAEKSTRHGSIFFS